jgi:hypothetical protein
MSELIERLREEWLQKATSSFTCQECGIQANFIDEIENALDAKDKRIEALEAGGWQPIETAPKDGTEILGIQYHGRFSDPGIVRWDDSDQEWWDMDADQYGFPTHWQPLPATPSRILNKEDRNG